MPDAILHLVDTSLWILALKPGARGHWIDELRFLIPQRQVGINPIIRMELLTGSRSEKEYGEITDVLGALTSLEVTDAVWQEACRLGFTLRRKGLTVPNTDILIAASAIHYRCILYHYDHHYQLIAKHSPLEEKTIVIKLNKGGNN